MGPIYQKRPKGRFRFKETREVCVFPSAWLVLTNMNPLSTGLIRFYEEIFLLLGLLAPKRGKPTRLLGKSMMS